MTWKTALALCLPLLAAPPAMALDEMLSIQSRTVSDEDFLRGDDTRGVPVTIDGRLSGPDSDGTLPVVILLHGTDGPRSGAAAAWRYHLKSLGIATLRLDSYTARKLGQASTRQETFGQFAQMYDAYRAADVLAAHPRVDSSRIVLMGFSRGGIAALYGAMSRFHRSFGPRRAKIIAYVSFYPACNFELVGELEVEAAPIREFHGTQDDWALAAPCRDYIRRLKGKGADAEITEYPDARHAFDSRLSPSHYRDPNAQTSRNCLRREKNNVLINAATGKPFSYSDACVEYGPSVQYNDAAYRAAHESVKVLLERLFARAE